VTDEFASVFPPATIRRGVEWLRGTGPESDVVISSRVRLARNLRAYPFVRRASARQRLEVMAAVRARLADERLRAGAGGGAWGGGEAGGERLAWLDIHRCSPLQRTLLVERHLISKEHARQGGSAAAKAPGASPAPAPAGAAPAVAPGESREGGGGGVGGEGAGGAGGAEGGDGGDPRGVAISMPDERLSLMINEEDHVRLQVLRSGMDVAAAFEQADRVDDLLEGAADDGGGGGGGGGGAPGIEYAFSARLGYLTACPTNVGTGIRVSVMLHLPALRLAGELDKVKRATRDLSLAVRGFYGEGSEAAGDFYQVSNQTTLGRSERAILDAFEHRIIPAVIEYERAARRALLARRRTVIEDQVMRALGVLRHARLLTPEEALAMLSQVRLGIYTGLVADVPPQTVNQLILLTQPAHLQQVLGRPMDQNARREARAELVRTQLSA
jgi:protein arginine kinase